MRILKQGRGIAIVGPTGAEKDNNSKSFNEIL
jgi:hypothetical protein